MNQPIVHASVQDAARNPRPLRVLHVLDHSIPLHSGYTFRTRAILQQQRALGWDTFHVTGPKQGKSSAATETVDGLTFHRTDSGALAGLPVLNQLDVINSLAKRLLQVAREVQPDILHAHSPALNAIAALRVGRQLGIPVVYEVRAFWEDAAVDHGTSTEWGLRYRLTRALETHALRNVDAATTICEGLRRDIVARGIPAAKVTVIPNAVDIEDFSTDGQRDAALAQQLGLDGKTVLGFIGSFYAYEGLNILLDALPALLAADPGIRVLLVGGGPQDAALKEQARRLGVEGQVVFTGRVPHDQVQRYYNLVDALVYPRLRMRLTDLVTPLKPLEAMAQGRVLVASDVGGHHELIEDGKTGMLFKAGDPQALAQRVLDLLRARAAWPALRARGRAFVEEQRNWHASVARYRAVYGALAGKDLGK
jgi:PEP-CTERM/exosortase A-associated glycosyltransferase